MFLPARPLISGLFLWTVLSSPAAADLTVGPPDSGADFSDLQAAIDAAVPGETLFVFPGQYRGGLLIDKSIDIIGAGPGATQLESVSSEPLFEVRGLAALDSVVLAGLGVLNGFESDALGMEVRNCQGPVTLADVAWAAPAQLVGLERLLWIEDCSRVIIDRCVFDAGSLRPIAGATRIAGLEASGSSLYVNNTVLMGGIGIEVEAGPGLRGFDVDVDLGSSQVTGGLGAFDVLSAPASGGPGVDLSANSRLELSGSGAMFVEGGTGGIDLALPANEAPGGPGARLAGGSVVVLSGGASLAGGQPFFGGPSAPPSVQDANSNLFFAFEPQLGLRSNDTLVQAGQPLQLEVKGLSFSSVGIFLGAETTSPVPVPGFAGDALISPATAFNLALVTTNFIGDATATIQVPGNAPPGLRGYIQAVDLGFVVAPAISLPVYVEVTP